MIAWPRDWALLVSEIELLKYGRYSRNNYLDVFDKMNDFLKYARGESDGSGNARVSKL